MDIDGLEFWKMSGSGNDFIIIDNRKGIIGENEKRLLVERLCRRRMSVGADGLIFVERSEILDFSWRFFNSDGGEVEMCGNGSRCVARFAYLNGIASNKMTFETLAGPISAEVYGKRVKVLMPRPKGLRLGMELRVNDRKITGDFINTGVPHFVVEVDQLDEYPVYERGKAVRYHPSFEPDGTNVDLFHLDEGKNIVYLRTYERGVEDETLACGTGAIAVALICNIRRGLNSPISVRTRSGEDLKIHFLKEGDEFRKVWLEGDTTLVYIGRLNNEAIL